MLKTDELHKHTFHLFKGDYERIRDLHPNVTPAETIRIIVRKHIERVEAAAPSPKLDVKIDL